MSKYDNIQSAKELVLEVQAHGLSTLQEDLCRAQDIFGNSSVEELVALANDIGRNNEKGEPDPKGSWSSSRRATQGTFYSIAFQIWNWEDATRFWNQHTNPEREEFVELRKQVRGLETQVKHYDEQLGQERELRQSEEVEAAKLKNKVEHLEIDVQVRNREITELKAKLYDLMVAQEGRA